MTLSMMVIMVLRILFPRFAWLKMIVIQFIGRILKEVITSSNKWRIKRQNHKPWTWLLSWIASHLTFWSYQRMLNRTSYIQSNNQNTQQSLTRIQTKLRVRSNTVKWYSEFLVYLSKQTWLVGKWKSLLIIRMIRDRKEWIYNRDSNLL